jgi:hypothetical protein
MTDGVTVGSADTWKNRAGGASMTQNSTIIFESFWHPTLLAQSSMRVVGS